MLGLYLIMFKFVVVKWIRMMASLQLGHILYLL